MAIEFWYTATPVAVLACGWWVWRKRRAGQVLEENLRRLGEGRELGSLDGLSRGVWGRTAQHLQMIADRQRTLENDARDARFDLHAILASLEDGVLVTDLRQQITLTNPALIQIFALKGGAIGQTVLSSLRLPILQTMLKGVLEEGVPQQAEVDLDPAGREEPSQLVVTAVPLRDAAGLTGAVLAFRDVSRLRRLEEMRREFVANVSHELRTPLSIFQGHLENLLDSPGFSSEEQRASLLVMRKHSLRLNALVEDLLTLARLESNRDPIQTEPIQPATFLQETVADWTGKASAKQIRLEVETEPELPEVRVDILKFQQVLDNLLDNAVKYTPEGGCVTLRARLAGEAMEFQVEDTGAGIAWEDLPHVFERFYRSDKARSRALGGTGLGLSIVKHIVQAHKGVVAAESEPGRGTRIIWSIPLDAAR